jgi:hypothetical protein
VIPNVRPPKRRSGVVERMQQAPDRVPFGYRVVVAEVPTQVQSEALQRGPFRRGEVITPVVAV